MPKIKEVYNFNIPVQYANAITNGSTLTDTEEESLCLFLSSLPDGGTWDFGNDEPEMENFNDVDSFAFSDCYQAVYTIFEK